MNERSEHELVPTDEIPDVRAGLFKAYSFRRASEPDNTYVLIWHTQDKADLLIPVAADRFVAMRPFGTRQPVETENGKAVLTIGDRTYIAFQGMPLDRAREIIRKAATL